MVIMDRKTYNEKKMEFLSDEDTYALINNPVRKLISKNKRLVQTLFDIKYIDEDTKNILIN